MINAVSQNCTNLIRSISASNTPMNLLDGQALQSKNQEARFDTVELSNDGVSRSPLLNAPSELKMEKPRARSIAIDTLDSRISHVESSIQKADSLHLSFGDRLTFLKNEGMNWAGQIEQSDPEMFAEWLKMNKENIVTGQPDLASLPSDFTMMDYSTYVKEPFSAFV